MANRKISELTPGNPALLTDQFPIARGTENRKLLLSDLFDLMQAGRVLSAEGGLNLPTTGTVEQLLKTVTIPAGLLGVNGPYCGFQMQASFKASGAVNNKTVRARIGGLAGTEIWNQVQSIGSLRWWLRAEIMVQAADLLHGFGQQTTTTTSAGNIYSFDGIAATFANPIDIAFTGQSAVAGELTLTAARVVLLAKV